MNLRICITVAVLGMLAAPPRPVEAQDSVGHILTAEEIGAVHERYQRLRDDVKTRTLAKCGPVLDSAELSDYPSPGASVIFKFSLEWSGGCRAGLREGLGVLTSTFEERTSTDNSVSVEFRKSEGHAVNGHDQGLWCNLEGRTEYRGKLLWQHAAGLRWCYVVAGHDKSAWFKKLDDSRWQQVDSLGTPVVPAAVLAAGALESESERIIALARAGKTDLTINEFSIQSDALDGLVAGATITRVLSKTPVSIKGKRVVVILSSRSIAELERFSGERQALIVASANVPGDAQLQRTRFIEASRQELLLQGIARKLRKMASSVEAADDLTGLAVGKFDYAFVVDWHSGSRLDLLGKYSRYPVAKSDSDSSAVVAGQSLGGFLVSPQLQAVAIIQSYTPEAFKNEACSDRKRSPTCDEAYLKTLADFYQSHWMSPEPGAGPFERRFR